MPGWRGVSFCVYEDAGRAGLKSAFRQMCTAVCERFAPNEGDVVGHRPRMRGKDPAKW